MVNDNQFGAKTLSHGAAWGRKQNFISSLAWGHLSLFTAPLATVSSECERNDVDDKKVSADGI